MPSPQPKKRSWFDLAEEVRLTPCTITATSPLTVTIGGTAGVLAVAQKNVTYSTGAALALVTRRGAPLIYQIGP